MQLVFGQGGGVAKRLPDVLKVQIRQIADDLLRGHLLAELRDLRLFEPVAA